MSICHVKRFRYYDINAQEFRSRPWWTIVQLIRLFDVNCTPIVRYKARCNGDFFGQNDVSQPVALTACCSSTAIRAGASVGLSKRRKTPISNKFSFAWWD